MDPDQSNASGTLWGPDPSSCVGLGRITMGFGVSFGFLEFVLCLPLFLLPEHLCTLIFLQKIPKIYHVFFEAFWII